MKLAARLAELLFKEMDDDHNRGKDSTMVYVSVMDDVMRIGIVKVTDFWQSDR